MKSHWDKLPEDICIVIYQIIHKEQMTLLINEIQYKYNRNRIFHYYTSPILNFWYIGVGLKALQPKHWDNTKKHHAKYNALYDSYLMWGF